ncbi:MAG: SUMF1/EgtB/PvdO family nonheme iron enzyme [Gimesia sp.]
MDKNSSSQNKNKRDSSSSVSAPQLKSSASKSRAKSRVKKKTPKLAGKPEDFFEVVDYVHNYQITKPQTESDAGDQFAVLLPTQNDMDSTIFTVIKSGIQEDQGTPDSEFELPEGFSAVAAAGYSAQGLPNRIRCEQDYSEMVLVPAGVSIQGQANGAKNTSPELTIYQNAFYIDVYEVTLEQYQRWRSDMITKKGKIPEPAGNDSRPTNFPAMGISFTDALNYARTMGKQIPLETQWEKAARGETGFMYPWGNGRALWYKTRKPGQIDPIGSFSGDFSPYGVFDLSGNAREWCADWYSDHSYQAAMALADAGVVHGWSGPKRPVIPSMRVVRGNQKTWDVRKRAGENMRTPPADVGFRCVLNLPESKDDSEDSPKR